MWVRFIFFSFFLFISKSSLALQCDLFSQVGAHPVRSWGLGLPFRYPKNLAELDSMLRSDWNELKVEDDFQQLRGGRFKDVAEVMGSRDLFFQWLEFFKDRVKGKMDQDQVPKWRRRFRGVVFRYVDQVVIEEATRHGLGLVDGRPYLLEVKQFDPFGHLKSSSERIEKLIREGILFYDRDFSGEFAVTKELKPFVHSERGHALQLLFLAHYLPNFVETYKRMDSEVWRIFFENGRYDAIVSVGAFHRVFIRYLSSSLSARD